MVEIGAKSGVETSEFKLANLVNIASILVVAAGAGLEMAAQIGIGDHWVGTALVIVGFLAKILNVKLYTSSRTQVKVAAINATKEQAVEEARVITSVPDALDRLNKFVEVK